MLAKLLHYRFFWPILLLILIIPTFSFLVRPGLYWNMHDDMQMVRQLEMEKCLKDGQIPCRWTPDLGFGYGYPLFNFYPPLPYLAGQIFRSFGFSFVATVKLSAILLITLSSLAMYLLASSLTGPIGGFLAGLFYTYAPYHAVNIFVRGAFNEAWSALFFPLIFYFSKKLLTSHLKTIYLFLLSLSWAGLLLSHNPMALTFAIFFAPWCLYWYWPSLEKKDFKPFIKLLIAGFMALFLSAFYTLPVLFETKLVQIESMFQNYYHYSVHFLSFRQLFLSNFWGDGPSVWMDPDGMSFSIGTLYWILPLFIFVYYLYTFNKKRNSKYLLPLLIIALSFLAVIMTHERFSFLWLLLKPIQKIQFPWRFLNHTLFFSSLSLAYLPKILNKIYPKIIYIILPILSLTVVLLNYKYFFPISYGPITDEQKFSGLAWTNQITSGIYDYLPKTASTAAKSKAAEIIDKVEPENTEYQLLGWQKGTDWWLFNLQNETSAKFTLASLYFPNFKLLDNQQDLKYEVEPELGRITINLDSGYHQIYLKFYNTPVRTISNYLSLFAWIFTIVFFISKLWKIKKFKK
ncbi:MAG: hypothetical protein PHR98_00405 [Candidatus Shapirobacteria bacterium]|nr:hypothetical protein [Candidatus Shapirobacteria bacterium]